MTFRPSVLPDRDNDILSTFVRSFERARQLRRADQADARANAEFTARQEDRQAARDESVFQQELEIARDPELSTGPESQMIQGLRQAAGGVSPAGAPDVTGVRRLAGSLAGPERVSLGEPSAEIGEVFFDPGARERTIREDAALQRDIDRPEREEAAAATAAERQELGDALRSQGVPEEEIPALVRDPAAARRRINQRPAAASGAGTSATERVRDEEVDAIMAQAASVNKPISRDQAIIFADQPRQFEDFLRPVPQAQQDLIMEDLDRMQERIDDIEADELSNEEKLERKKRALIDGGFLGTAEAFGVGLARFQDARQEARNMAGTFLQQETPEPGGEPSETSGLGGDSERQQISPTQIPAIAAAIEDLNFADRNEAIDRLAPFATANDRAAIMRAAGPAPTPDN
jgi:hypothetical protein